MKTEKKPLTVLLSVLMIVSVLLFSSCSQGSNDIQSETVNSTDSQTALQEQDTNEVTSNSDTTTTSLVTTHRRDSMVFPETSQYVDDHDIEIWSDEIGYDDYINIRYGPSKEDYDVVKKVQNGTYGVGLSEPVNGWVFVEVEGQRGWVRADLALHTDEMGGMAKPVLYLYPDKPIVVSVKLTLKNSSFSCTYPDYGNGWKVKAYPDGKVINNADGKEYSYLYWELNSNVKFDLSKGFIVRGKDTAAFLQKTLAQMGLQPKEYNEFIVYWLPRMQNNEYNLISFQTKAYTDNVKLNISPKPDSVLRVNMAYKPLNAKEANNQKSRIKTQKFSKFERKGFTVVEWGGEVVIN